MTRVEDLDLANKHRDMFFGTMDMKAEDMFETVDPLEVEILSSLEQQQNGNIDCTVVYPLSSTTDKEKQMKEAEDKIKAKLRHLGISHGKVSSETIGSRRYHRKIAKQRKKYANKYKVDVGIYQEH